jgi:hypothetical protein
MHKSFLFLIIIIILAPINLSENSNEEKAAETNTIAKVYVYPPNFKVIEENSHDTFTIINKAPIPNSYQGTLIKLESNDLTDITRAIKNLNTKKVILFKEDEDLAQNIPIETEII